MADRPLPAGLSIRPLRTADGALYRDIRLDGLQRHPEAFGASHEEEARLTEAEFAERIPAGPRDVILGAFVEDLAAPPSLVGIGGFAAASRLKQRHRGNVWGVYVRASARGRGIAAALIARLVEHARGIEGMEIVELTVESTNQAARAVYEAAGFQAYGVERQSIKLGPGEYWHAELRRLDLTGGR